MMDWLFVNNIECECERENQFIDKERKIVCALD